EQGETVVHNGVLVMGPLNRSAERANNTSQLYFFFQAEDGIRDRNVTGVQTCALPISGTGGPGGPAARGTPDLNGGSNGAPREDASHSGRYPRLHDVRLLRPRLPGVSGGGLGGRFASRSRLRHAPVRNARTAGPAAASSGEARR